MDTRSEDSSELQNEVSTTWNEAQEVLLKAISERSNCMRWLHTRCNHYFDSLNFYLTIPNIVISTLNGGVTMSLSSLFPSPENQRYATTIIGVVSIFSAVLTTLNQYIKCQQMAESHRSAGISYAKINRNINNELALRRDQRSDALEFLKQIRAEQDRLENTAPSILPKVIVEFNVEFADRDIEKPEIAGDLDKTEINMLRISKSKKHIHRIAKVLPNSSSPKLILKDNLDTPLIVENHDKANN